LRSLGYDVIEHRFEDHYKFQLSDLNFGDSLPVVMTEKDAAKCRLLKPGIIHKDFWFLSVDVEISDKFLQVVLDKAGLSTIPLATAE
jgi:tetraacyldisaccharide 4'-kinase